jgi:hypothetical protein
MKRLRALSAAAVLIAILPLATASASRAAGWGWHHRHFHHHGGAAGSWNSHPRNAESAWPDWARRARDRTIFFVTPVNAFRRPEHVILWMGKWGPCEARLDFFQICLTVQTEATAMHLHIYRDKSRSGHFDLVSGGDHPWTIDLVAVTAAAVLVVGFAGALVLQLVR